MNMAVYWLSERLSASQEELRSKHQVITFTSKQPQHSD